VVAGTEAHAAAAVAVAAAQLNADTGAVKGRA